MPGHQKLLWDTPFAYGYTDAFQGDYSELIYLRARQYSPGMGRFLTRDTWSGDKNQPITLNKWVYANANPIVYIDPTGRSAFIKYDRAAAVAYALEYAATPNSPKYRFFEADCTNFVSQALHAGGIPEDTTYGWWKYDENGRNAWAITDEFLSYFVGLRGFSISRISGTMSPAKVEDYPDIRKEDDSRFLANERNPADKVIPSPIRKRDKAGKDNYGQFDFSGYGIRPGDVVIYRQLHSNYIRDGHGLFNHAAFVVALGPLTDRYRERTYPSHIAPMIAEHSGGYENNRGYLSQENNVHSINDTWTEVQEIIVIHIPDFIVNFGAECP